MDEATEVGRFLTSSNEAYAAHFLHVQVPANNVEPRNRLQHPPRYSAPLCRDCLEGSPAGYLCLLQRQRQRGQNQGYSLHHATGWYLNFGYPGLLWATCSWIVAGTRMRAKSMIAPKTELMFR